VEAQAAVSLPTYGSRGRITAPGLPKKEVEQLLSCLSQLEDVDIEDLSFTIQCRLPGERVYRSLLGLPLAMALLSSYLQREIPSHHIYIGELDLQKRVRKVPDSLIEELWESIENGKLRTPLRLFCPRESATLIREGLPDATIVACDTLEDAVFKTWTDLNPK
jgi:DNA repair protein RadA/Sms